MPRTATTFFQRVVFPEFRALNYVGLPFTQINPLFQNLMYEDDSTYQPSALRSWVQSHGNQPLLLSNENFAGQALYWHYGNRTRIATRLQQAMPDSTVLLFLRNQPELLKSMYLIALQDKETCSLHDFVRFESPVYQPESYSSQPAVDLFDWAKFDTYHACEFAPGYRYLPMVKLYKSLFPSVEVFLYEDFKSNPQEVLRRLEAIFEHQLDEKVLEQILTTQPLNQGVDEWQAKKLRALNRWYPLAEKSRVGRGIYHRMKRRILAGSGGETPVEWTPSDMEKFKSLFADDNREIHWKYPEIGINRHAGAYLFG
ncbi:MAG: hypothetical protein EA392_08755 [Cryomorphaceae bacterium]|nr:MAG: hypothetical protein EA392_08755 [Cryomorphaceae bacterium]